MPVNATETALHLRSDDRPLQHLQAISVCPECIIAWRCKSSMRKVVVALAKGKGFRGDSGSEVSRRQNSATTKRNQIGGSK